MNSYGAPSFYAQSMFAEFLGTEVPVSTVQGEGHRFFYSVTHDPSKETVYLKLVNASSIAQSIDIAITGVSSVDKAGILVTLQGDNPTKTNTITAPTRIVPVKSTINIAGTKFNHRMPPYSVQVLELHAKELGH